DRLIDRGRLRMAKRFLPLAIDAFPQAGFFRTMDMVLARLPSWRWQPGLAPFRNDLSADVQIIRRRGADTMLLAFAGHGHKLGLSLSLMHHWFARLGVHIVYLRDLHHKLYCNGVRGLAPDVDGSI